MSTTHHPEKHHPDQIHIQIQPSRTVRCYRHHVSMASCEQCARVRTAELARRRAAAENVN